LLNIFNLISQSTDIIIGVTARKSDINNIENTENIEEEYFLYFSIIDYNLFREFRGGNNHNNNSLSSSSGFEKKFEKN